MKTNPVKRLTKTNHYFCFIFIFFLSPYSFAQNDTLTQHLPEGCYHSGEYEQNKTIAGVDKEIKTTGKFLFNCDHGLLWHTQTPILETLIYKTKGNHLIINADGAVKSLEGRVHRELGKLLTNLIGGNEEYLTQNFLSKAIDTAKNGNKTQGIELTPKSKQMQKFLHTLQITQHADSVSITLFLAENETTHIQISGRRSFNDMSVAQCAQVISLLPACNALFEPLLKGAK